MEATYSATSSQHSEVKFSGYTRGQNFVLAAATITAIAVTILASLVAGPLVGIVVGGVTGACVLGLFINFRARVLDAEVYLLDHPTERTYILSPWMIYPRPQNVNIFWRGRTKYVSPSRGYFSSYTRSEPARGRPSQERYERSGADMRQVPGTSYAVGSGSRSAFSGGSSHVAVGGGSRSSVSSGGSRSAFGGGGSHVAVGGGGSRSSFGGGASHSVGGGGGTHVRVGGRR